MKMLELATVAVCLGLAAPVAAESEPDQELGRRIYRKACLACHGAQGDGNGPGARSLDPPPRDFTGGVYKFRSTPSGKLPTDDDLYRTISQGVPGTAMPAWKRNLTSTELRAVIQYIKAFSPKFANKKKLGTPVEIGAPPARTSRTLANGRKLYGLMQCGKCHGKEGRGDGPAADTLKDDRGRKMRAYDMTTGRYRGGSRLADVYRTMATGVMGTPMPAYADSMEPQQVWELAHYIKSLERDSGLWDYLFDARASWE